MQRLQCLAILNRVSAQKSATMAAHTLLAAAAAAAATVKSFSCKPLVWHHAIGRWQRVAQLSEPRFEMECTKGFGAYYVNAVCVKCLNIDATDQAGHSYANKLRPMLLQTQVVANTGCCKHQWHSRSGHSKSTTQVYSH
jgi:hypothetical protein